LEKKKRLSLSRKTRAAAPAVRHQVTASGESASIMVGIPFRNEVDRIEGVFKTAAKGLAEFFPDRNCFIACAGMPDGQDTLDAIQKLSPGHGIKKIAFLIKGEAAGGKAPAIRALLETASQHNADLALLEPDLNSRKANGKTEGLAPEWVDRLITPIDKENMDLVIPAFNYHYLDNVISSQLVSPLLSAIFNLKVGALPETTLGISRKLIKTYLASYNACGDQPGEHGMDISLITTAVINEAKICQTSLGVKIHPGYSEKESAWREQIKAIFDQVSACRNWWQQRGEIIYPLPVFRDRKSQQPDEVAPDPQAIEKYRQGFLEFHGLYEEILSREVLEKLHRLAGTDQKFFRLPAQLWVDIVYDFLLAYCMEPEFDCNSVLNAFLPICHAREAALTRDIEAFRQRANGNIASKTEQLSTLVAAQEIEQQAEEFIRRKPDFLIAWKEKEEEIKPFLPIITYREFIPGYPLILPKEFTSPAGESISADRIHSDIVQSQYEQFMELYTKHFNVSHEPTVNEIAENMKKLMLQVEQDMHQNLLRGDLATVEGAREIAGAILQQLSPSQLFTIKPEVAALILRRNRPTNLLLAFDAASLAELEQRYEPKDILALSSLSEEAEYTETLWEWIAGNARPEHFARLPLKPLAVSYENFSSLALLKEPSLSSKLAGRLLVSNVRREEGGKFPKIRYFLMMAKNIVEAEKFGEIWEQFAWERKEFGTRVANSLKGHWGKDPLSAHNMFEARIQEMLVERIRKIIQLLGEKEDHSLSRLARNLSLLMDCYFLAPTLPDGFVPCSAWTWASYSFKGGRGIPTPFSLHVERDWASREFLAGLYQAVGGSEEKIDGKIVELMGQGKESENLAKTLFS